MSYDDQKYYVNQRIRITDVAGATAGGTAAATTLTNTRVPRAMKITGADVNVVAVTGGGGGQFHLQKVSGTTVTAFGTHGFGTSALGTTTIGTAGATISIGTIAETTFAADDIIRLAKSTTAAADSMVAGIDVTFRETF